MGLIEIGEIIVGLIIVAVIFLSTIVTVRQTHRALIERWGKYNRFAEPGIHFKIPFIEEVIFVNVTERMVNAEPQEIITKDNLNAQVDAQIYFKVLPTEKAVMASEYNVNDYATQIVSLARTTLRDTIGNMAFQDVNSMRGKINSDLANQLAEQTTAWGIAIVRTELKEIQPPPNVQETMNKILIAENEKRAAVDFATATETKADGERRAAVRLAEGDRQANILRAEGEAKSIELVNSAAQKYFTGNAVDLKKLQTARQMFENNTKIIASSDMPILELISKVIGLTEKPVEKKEKKEQ